MIILFLFFLFSFLFFVEIPFFEKRNFSGKLTTKETCLHWIGIVEVLMVVLIIVVYSRRIFSHITSSVLFI